MKRRKAFTLMEIIVVMALLGVVAGFGFIFIIDFTRLARRHAQWSMMTDQSFLLAEYVRKDVARAARVVVEDAALHVERLDGTRIRYVLEGETLRRIVAKDDKEERAGLRIPCRRAKWEVPEDGKLVSAELTLAAPGPSRTMATFPFVIKAAVAAGGAL